ncbi:anaerobic dimethyl sulfoxide reductase chain A [Cutibacterium acnes JCM 18918]|nr:anaerobic dimethyl sulfoxide reductase chain A [Cutibacterium acnes JCM 18918]
MAAGSERLRPAHEHVGGYLDHYSDYSTTEITQAYPYFYGSWVGSNSFDDVKKTPNFRSCLATTLRKHACQAAAKCSFPSRHARPRVYAR